MIKLKSDSSAAFLPTEQSCFSFPEILHKKKLEKEAFQD